MFRTTLVTQHFRAKFELDRIRSLLRGRARLERKVGLKRLYFLMRTQTRYRVEQKAFWERAIVRKNIDSAAQEHGTSWVYLRNDLARQNLLLLPRMQQTLAQYEPFSFRAIVELCASRVAPPLPPRTAEIPEEVYTLPSSTNAREENNVKSNNFNVKDYNSHRSSHPAARRELREGIARMLGTGDWERLLKGGPDSVERWMEVWKEFDVGGECGEPDVNHEKEASF